MKFLIAITAFVSGFIILSLEIMGFRALAPHFGYSIYVFGSLIGLILFALAVGYWAGGLLSRRNFKHKHFFLILLGAGLYLTLASAFYPRLLEELGQYGVVEGALTATFVLWAFPMAAFAAVSPYLIGLWSEKEHAGHSAGWISAIGTLGGLAGTFLTSFYLLPTFGTHATFSGNAYAAVLLPIVWLFMSDKKWILVFLLAPLITQALPPPPNAPNVVHAEESAYGHLEVVDYGTYWGLRTERRTGTIYSAMPKDRSLPAFLLYDLFAVPAAAVNAKQGLLLGLGAGTLPRIHEILNPDLRLEGVEIDPRVVALGKRFFSLDETKNLNSIVVADARPFLTQTPKKYDLIEMDVFREAEIPFYLVSKEFFELVRNRINPGGIFMMNIYDTSSDRRVERAVANTAATVFPETYVVPAWAGSFLLVGSESPLTVPDPNSLENGVLAGLVTYFQEQAEKVNFSPQEQVFTDDRAPIELLVATTPGLS